MLFEEVIWCEGKGRKEEKRKMNIISLLRTYMNQKAKRVSGKENVSFRLYKMIKVKKKKKETLNFEKLLNKILPLSFYCMLKKYMGTRK